MAYVIGTALRLAGFEIGETSNGHGLRFALPRRATPGIFIVLDVQDFPIFNGFEVCRRLRFAGVNTPVIFLTAADSVAGPVSGLTIGGDDYLIKPFSVEELVARVNVILHRTGRSAESRVLACGDLELDDTSHVVTQGGQDVPLSPTEYKLLRFLLRNAGRALPRDQILDHVWDYDFDGESTVVETYISMLRKKVDSATRR